MYVYYVGRIPIAYPQANLQRDQPSTLANNSEQNYFM